MHRRAAFTYIELMIVVVVAAILTVVAISDSQSALSAQGERAAEQVAADISFARTLAISDPDSTNPVIIKVDVDNNKYWVARKQTKDTPVAHPKTGKPYVVTFGEDGDPGFEHVDIVGTDFDGDVILEFDSFGGTTQDAAGIVQLTAGDVEYEVSVATTAADAEIGEGFTKTAAVTKDETPAATQGQTGQLPAGTQGATQTQGTLK